MHLFYQQTEYNIELVKPLNAKQSEQMLMHGDLALSSVKYLKYASSYMHIIQKASIIYNKDTSKLCHAYT